MHAPHLHIVRGLWIAGLSLLLAFAFMVLSEAMGWSLARVAE
jgi:hypothetical protein